MKMVEIIENKLHDALEPSFLEVRNESHLHAGHAGDDGSGESHFCLVIASDKFKGLSRVNKERIIYDVLVNEMKIIHALSIQIKES